MTDTHTIELWIDALNAVWGFEYGRGKLVRTPSMIVKSEIPASLNMADGPLALSEPLRVSAKYGASSSSISTILIWHGVTYLYLTPDVKPENDSFILPFFGRILAAAKANMTLGGLVAIFQLEEDPSIEMQPLYYGGANEPHDGLVIHWTVKQNLSGQI